MLTNCQSCGASIDFIVSEKGRRVPVDAKPLTVFTPDGRAVKGYQSHFATCPQAAEWRGKKRQPKAAAPMAEEVER
jgi:hypothetical protein